jgi:hypothetical protein
MHNASILCSLRQNLVSYPSMRRGIQPLPSISLPCHYISADADMALVSKRGQNKFSVCEILPHLVWWPGLKNSPTVTHACSKR